MKKYRVMMNPVSGRCRIEMRRRLFFWELCQGNWTHDSKEQAFDVIKHWEEEERVKKAKWVEVKDESNQARQS